MSDARAPSGPTGVARPLRVAVAGAGDAGPAVRALAEALGRRVAEAGAVVLCGGRGGVMEAVARGAAEAGGTVVGILPGETDSDASPWVTIPLPTGLGEARNTLVARCGQALLAVGGSWGTLSELALAQKLHVPVAVVGEPSFPELGLRAFSDPAEAAEWAVRRAAGGIESS